MKRASLAETCFSADTGGPVSRGAADTLTDSHAPVPPEEVKSALSLWLWVTAAFFMLLMAWLVLFTVARSAKIESVPLSTSGGGTR
jgi:hypothetical protein